MLEDRILMVASMGQIELNNFLLEIFIISDLKPYSYEDH